MVHLRTDLTHEALCVVYGVGSSSIDRAINEIRPLLTARGSRRHPSGHPAQAEH
ncbi:hypothetical protein ACFUIT_32285 [Streptomyces sp. NPDC057239]|uniref:hypothetical protein n=1 Tax=Streptomyces sp. NPDC057239 TaxID=3346061 RepID=UPI003626880A